MDAPRILRPLIFVAAALLLSFPASAALTVNGLTTTTVQITGATPYGQVVVGSSTDAQLTFTVASPIVYDEAPGNWLAVSATGTTGSDPNLFLNLSSVPVGTGIFHATVTLNGSDASTATIKVVFSPTGGAVSSVSASPNPLDISLQNTLSGQSTITVSSTVVTPTTFTVQVLNATSGLQLTSNPASGSVVAGGPVVLTINASVSSSAAATYTATVEIQPAGMAVIDVPVTVTVSGGGSGGCVTSTLTLSYLNQTGCSSVNVTFNYNTGDTVSPVAIAIQSASGATLYTVQSIVTSNAVSWLLANGSGSSTQKNISDGLTVGLEPEQVAALAVGSYTGTITLVSYPDGATATVNVTLNVNGGGSGQPVTASPAQWNPTAAVGGQAQTQSFQLTLGAGVTVDSVTSDSSWLTVNQPDANHAFTATATPGSLSAGVYTGNIRILYYSILQVVVPVTFTVTSGGSTGGNVTLDKTSLNFTWQTGATPPAAQTVRVTSAAGSAQVSFAVTSSAAWLIAAPANSTTPANLQVSVAPGGMVPGNYNGTLTITPNGGTQQTIPVALTVTAPAISVDTTPLTFIYRPGDPNPAAKTIQVTGGSNASFAASATTSKGGNWLSVSPQSGTANPTNLSVSVNPSGLSADTYTGTVSVNGANGSGGAFTVNVTLNVQPPLPTITQFGNAASYYAGSLAPGEIFSLFGTDLGPTAASGPIVQNGFLATTVAGVQVFVSGYPAPLTYVSGGQINAVVPYEVKTLKNASVWVKFLGQTSNTITLPVTAAAPGIFTANGSGSGQGAILNEDNTYNGATAPFVPTAKGKVIQVFMTGEGDTVPAGVTGKVTVVQPNPPITPGPAGNVAVLIDGIPVTPEFMGEAPTLVSGVMQLNLRIPQNAHSGDVPLQISVGSYTSKTVTVRVQ